MVLLPDLDPVVGQCRSRFDAAVAGIPAQLSVLLPWIEPAELTEADLDAVGQLAKSWEPFEVRFAGFGSAASDPGGHWLVPEAAEPFLALADDFGTCWPEYEPEEGFVPRLTVASTGSSEELEPMFAAIRAALPISTIATELAVLQVQDGRCQVRRSFRLGGKKR